MDPNLIPLTKQKMEKAMNVLAEDLKTIRTGKAAPSLIENIEVMVYGGSSKLKVMELATINSNDPKTLVVTPFDASILDELRRGIQDSGAGLNPVDDGQVLRITIPPLSEERREELIDLMHKNLENAKITVRQIRHHAMSEIKKADLSEDETSRSEKEVQKLTDEIVSEIDSIGSRKEIELRQV